MKNNNFYRRFQGKANSELAQIINNPKSYTEDALIAASQILQERKLEFSEDQKETIELIETRVKEKQFEEENSIEEKEYFTLTKRGIALFIDLSILSVISYFFGFLLIETPLIKAPWEPILSLVIILGYFTVFNSSIGKRTLGKKVMGLKVKDYNLKPLKLTNSFIRYSLLISPFFVFKILNYLSFNSFGVLDGLKYTYYVGIVYFMITDKELRRSFHDLITKSFVKPENRDETNFNYSIKKLKAFYFIAFGIITLSIILNVNSRSNATTETVDFETQTQQHQTILDDNTSIIENMIIEIKGIEGVAEIEGINFKIINGTTNLEIIIRPSYLFMKEDLENQVYEIFKSKELKVDNLKVIKHIGLDMTLAEFNMTRIKNYEQ
ncbi:RDD family protein [Flammeovirga pacifica]|uniref:RDD domain-containing protein n=1 Tax=Flammeovirga pacifica TaxID=915059 RepID=A0A1S1YU43_FLAPC|nr:RDD family protein [Flammeovirga pacifica]OHX64539.1 hypothetical protein NH26_23480 [Flammeovirga pacifica]